MYFVLFLGKKNWKTLKRQKQNFKSDTESTTSSGSSRLSATKMKLVVDQLLARQTRDSTSRTYQSVWRQFNLFLVNLDKMPDSWENRATLFIGYMVQRGMQSSTVKSYVSAIKKILITDGYKWQDSEILLSSLARACKLKNDSVRTRLPIHVSLLEMLLFEIQRIFRKRCQPYLEKLYLALFTLGYYGLMRVGELTQSPHVAKARDVHLAINKQKLLVVLYSSKTHSAGNRPQKIKITAIGKEMRKRNFCPFKILADFIDVRGSYLDDLEPFFIFRD